MVYKCLKQAHYTDASAWIIHNEILFRNNIVLNAITNRTLYPSC